MKPPSAKPPPVKPDLTRLLIGPAGLLIGLLLYGATLKLPPAQQTWAAGALMALLGVAALFYARSIGERWVQVLGWVLIAYGVLRALVLR